MSIASGICLSRMIPMVYEITLDDDEDEFKCTASGARTDNGDEDPTEKV